MERVQKKKEGRHKAWKQELEIYISFLIIFLFETQIIYFYASSTKYKLLSIY